MQLMFEIFCNRLINPAATVGAPEGWHTTPAVLEQYAKKVAEVGAARARALAHECIHIVAV